MSWRNRTTAGRLDRHAARAARDDGFGFGASAELGNQENWGLGPTAPAGPGQSPGLSLQNKPAQVPFGGQGGDAFADVGGVHRYLRTWAVAGGEGDFLEQLFEHGC
jgi:hypothetical protein